MSSDSPALLSPHRRDRIAPALVAGNDLVRTGAELVALSERFYCAIFGGLAALVGVAAVAALVLLPLRAGSASPPVIGVIGGGLLAATTPLALWRTKRLYCVLRRRLAAQIGIVLYATALVVAVFPLRSQLWWPSCALLMLVAVVAPLRRVLTYCLVVLAVNLLAHLATGDVDRTPAVSIIGLWVGYIFCCATVAMVSDQLAAYLLCLNSGGEPRSPEGLKPLHVASWRTDHHEAGDPAGQPTPSEGAAADPPEGVGHHGATPQVDGRLPELPEVNPGLHDRLTARQLQVLALLADGLRYREVAACLSISDRQVQRHVAHAVARLGLRNASELIAVAVRDRLVPDRTTTREADGTPADEPGSADR